MPELAKRTTNAGVAVADRRQVSSAREKPQGARVPAGYDQRGAGLGSGSPGDHGAPGEGGVTVRVMSLVWKDLGPCLVWLYNYALRTGRFFSPWKGADVVLFPKEGGTLPR